MSLKEAAVKGTVWRVLENTISQVLSFVVFLVLARMLNPEAYGVIALATMITVFLTAISAFGIEQTIVQREDLMQEHLTSAFYLSCILSGIIYLLLIFGAGVVSEWFSEPALLQVLPWLGLTLVLNSLSTVPRGILVRKFMFKQLAVRTISAIAMGGVVGIWMALQGYTVWALVGQQLAIAITSAIIFWASCRWVPSGRFNWIYISDTLSFSMNVLGFQLMTVISRRSDNFIIGYFQGSIALGVYSIGFKIYDVASQVILRSMSSVAFPAFSRMHGNVEKLRGAYYTAVVVSTSIALPIFLMLILLSDKIVPLVFGEQWRGSVPVLQFLMVAACVNSITYFNSSLLLALGRAKENFRLSMLNMILNIVVFLVAVRWGIVAVAAAFTVSTFLMLPLSMYVLKSYLAISVSEIILKMKAHFAGLICLTLSVVLVEGHLSDFSIWLQLALQIGLGLGVYMATLFLLDRVLFMQLYGLAAIAVRRS